MKLISVQAFHSDGLVSFQETSEEDLKAKDQTSIFEEGNKQIVLQKYKAFVLHKKLSPKVYLFSYAPSYV